MPRQEHQRQFAMDRDRPTATDEFHNEDCFSIQRADKPTPHGEHAHILKLVLTTALLNGLELFDFTVFGLFAAIIAGQFFPFANAANAVLLAVGTFGAGFLVRPLGAMMIGAYADRFGRRSALLATCWLATLGTAAIALCPPYATLGIAAPLIVVAARFVQGLAAGGEIGPAAALIMEAAPASRRGYVVGLQLAGNGLAPLLGASVGTLMSSVLSHAQLAAWGWRIAFAVGIPLVLVAYYARRQLFDTDGGYSDRSGDGERTCGPVGELFQHHGRTLFLATLLMCFRTVPLYAIVLYMPTYMSHVIHKPVVTGFFSSAISALLLMLLAPLSGLLIDTLPRRKPLLVATTVASALAVYPLFLLITRVGSAAALLIGVSCMTAIIAIGGCVATVLVLEALPRHVRATGHGTSYALGVALFGSTAQFIVTALIKWTGNPMSIAWYVAPCCLLSVGAALGLRENRSRR
jgi:MFS transporter, MHS family, proline/betaine transporter